MYGIIRFILGVALLIPLIIVGKKKRAKTISLVICFCFIMCAHFFPIENAFITFDSVESAYDYYNFKSKEIQTVVSGINCDLIVGMDAKNLSHIIFPKTREGWKIGIASNTKIVYKYVDEAFVVECYRYKNEQDRFITVYSLLGNDIDISDTNGTEFFNIEVDGQISKVYYGYIDALSEGYILHVDGNEVPFYKE